MAVIERRNRSADRQLLAGNSHRHRRSTVVIPRLCRRYRSRIGNWWSARACRCGSPRPAPARATTHTASQRMCAVVQTDGVDQCTVGLAQATGPTTLDDATPSSIGLTSDEAQRRLASVDANTLPDTATHPGRIALGKFWAPVPWMLESAIALQLALGSSVSHF